MSGVNVASASTAARLKALNPAFSHRFLHEQLQLHRGAIQQFVLLATRPTAARARRGWQRIWRYAGTMHRLNTLAVDFLTTCLQAVTAAVSAFFFLSWKRLHDNEIARVAMIRMVQCAGVKRFVWGAW